MTLLLLVNLAVVSPPSGANVFLMGDNAERAGAFENAARLFQECAADSETLRPYALSRAAKNLGEAGRHADAEALFQRVLKEHPQGPWVRLTLARLAELGLKMKDREKAHLYYTRVLEGLEPRPWFLNPVVVRRAVNALDLPAHAAEGYAYFRDVAATTISSSDRIAAAQRLLKSSDRDDRLWGAYGLARAGSTKAAREALAKETLSIRGPGNASAPLFSLDEVLKSDGVAGLPRLDALLGANADRFEVRVWLMLVLREQGEAKEWTLAESLADLMARHFSEGRDAGDAYWWLSERYEKKPDALAADRMYRRLIETCPDHVRVPRSLLNLGTRAQKEGRFTEALGSFQKLAESFPDGQFHAESLYRCAQIAGEQGNKEARKRYLQQAADAGLGQFYAHRALYWLRLEGGAANGGSDRMKMLISGLLLEPMAVGNGKVAEPESPLTATVACERLQFFGINGLEEGEWEALECLRADAGAFGDAWYPVIAETGYAYTAFQYAAAREWGLKDGKPTLDRLRLMYPLAYWPSMKAVAEELRIDPFFLLALARQESTFRAGIVSSAGATGVLQVMPDTAKWLASKDDRISADHIANLKAPENSLRLGSVYLRRMLDRSDGNPVFALASYNAGPGNCDKWRTRNSGSTLEQFVEAIPFSETNDYVKKVLANYAAYHSVYPSAGKAGSIPGE